MDVCVCVLLLGGVRFAKDLNTTISTKYAHENILSQFRVPILLGLERVAKGPRQGSFGEQ